MDRSIVSGRARAGFTLLEVAIVIALIAMIAGGIIGGKTLIRSSQMRKVLTDAVTYRGAMNQFKEQYGYLPGDFPTAVQVWGRADGGTDLSSNCANPNTDASTDGKATCNGNGSGVIDGSGTAEHFRAFQQLSAAELISGKYTGAWVGATFLTSVANTNVPAGPLPGSAFFINNYGVQESSTVFYKGNYQNPLLFGGVTTNNLPIVPMLNPKEMAQLDGKADDGSPAYGSIRSEKTAYNGGSPACVSSDSENSAKYVLSTTAPACMAIFMASFHSPQGAE